VSILGRIFGTKEVITKAADGIYNGLDAMVLTDEERVQYHLDFLKAYEPFKLAQRGLAFIVAIPYVAVWIVSAVLYVMSMTLPVCAVDVQCMSLTLEQGGKTLATMNNDTLGLPFAIILGFYFAGGAVEGIMSKRAKGKS
jgi:hypothetical protein